MLKHNFSSKPQKFQILNCACVYIAEWTPADAKLTIRKDLGSTTDETFKQSLLLHLERGK